MATIDTADVPRALSDALTALHTTRAAVKAAAAGVYNPPPPETATTGKPAPAAKAAAP